MAYHATTMANTVNAPLLVFSRQGNMPALLSHYRPDYPVFAFTGEEAGAGQSGQAWQVAGMGETQVEYSTVWSQDWPFLYTQDQHDAHVNSWNVSTCTGMVACSVCTYWFVGPHHLEPLDSKSSNTMP